MRDPRIDRLADVLVGHSTRVQKGDVVLINGFDLPDAQLVSALIERVGERGGLPILELQDNASLRSLYLHAPEETFRLLGEIDAERMRRCDCYIGVRGSANTSEMVDVPADRLEAVQTLWRKPVHLEHRVPNTRWVVLRYPNGSMAQAADMSTAAFEDHYFDVCTADYAAMAERQKPLVKAMEAANEVRITGPGTDLTFNIEGIPVVPCNGLRNIPDGEVFTCPHRESANGRITYNTPSRYQGQVFKDIGFVFEKGRIVEATCDGDEARLNQILDTDEGARYLGEWSMGCNNAVTRPMLDTLFDEKIGGSMHLTPGNAYDSADNGNKSAVHWDIVLRQTADCGGGEIHFDGQCVRRDGLFLPAELQPLNEGL